MRISIWQQFASNHSANYTVVGIFESAEKATQVAQEITDFLQELTVWNVENNLESKFFIEHGWIPTPPEVKITRKYNIDWGDPIDWARLVNVPGRWSIPIDDFVCTFDNLVFLSPPRVDFTWQTGHHFTRLFQAMGGKAIKEAIAGTNPSGEEEFIGLVVDISCTAPNLKIAQEVHAQLMILTYDGNYSGPAYIIPWIEYHPKLSKRIGAISLEDIRQMEHVYIQEPDSWAQFYKTPECSVYAHMRSEVQLYNGIMTLNGINLQIKNTNAVFGLRFAFPAFISWLNALGFSDIEYCFREIE